jgi:hypothetical protein
MALYQVSGPAVLGQFLVERLKGGMVTLKLPGTDHAEECGSISTVEEPPLLLPADEPRSSLIDCLDHTGSHTGGRMRFDKDGLETISCGAVGDTPRAQSALQFIDGVNSTNVDIAASTRAANALGVGCLDRTRSDGIGVVGEVRKILRLLQHAGHPCSASGILAVEFSDPWSVAGLGAIAW